MARITVDDCLEFIPNRFELTLAASLRARQISIGNTALVAEIMTNQPLLPSEKSRVVR